MITTIPLMPVPYASVRPLVRGYYPIASAMLKLFPSLETELEDAGSRLDAKEYVAGALLTFTLYLLFSGFILVAWAYRTGYAADISARLIVVSVSVAFSSLILFYTLLFPKWLANKKRNEFEANLLFATRHLMVQTSAGVPLFDAIVSISEQYGTPEMDYGEISNEFGKIVKEVKGGKEFTQALEDSASRNPSAYYRRIIWQLANSNKSGANTGAVLRNIVEFLSDEQRIAIRNYGSQLNPLSLFYMLTCVIGPTMGLVLLMVASTFVDVPINDMVFGVALVLLMVMQVMFIGLIKSRRPRVAL